MDTISPFLKRRHITFKVICFLLIIALLWNEVPPLGRGFGGQTFASDEIRSCLSTPSIFNYLSTRAGEFRGYDIEFTYPGYLLMHLIADALVDEQETREPISDATIVSNIEQLIAKRHGYEKLNAYRWRELHREGGSFVLPLQNSTKSHKFAIKRPADSETGNVILAIDLSTKKDGKSYTVLVTKIGSKNPILTLRQEKLIEYGVYTKDELLRVQDLYEEYAKGRDISSFSSYEKVFIWQYMILSRFHVGRQDNLFKIIEREVANINSGDEVNGLYLGYKWSSHLAVEDKVETVTGNIRIKPGHRLLDVGCGDGRVIINLAQLNPDAHFVGIDANPYNISKAISITMNMEKPYLRNLTFHLRDCRSPDKDRQVPNRGIPYEDDSFDTTLLLEGVMDANDFRDAWASLIWAEVTRVAKKDGGRIALFGLRGANPILPSDIKAEREMALFNIKGKQQEYYYPPWQTEEDPSPYRREATEFYVWRLSNKEKDSLKPEESKALPVAETDQEGPAQLDLFSDDIIKCILFLLGIGAILAAMFLPVPVTQYQMAGGLWMGVLGGILALGDKISIRFLPKGQQSSSVMTRSFDNNDPERIIRDRTLSTKKRRIKFKDDVHFHTSFWAKEARSIYNEVFNQNTEAGLLIDMLKRKASFGERRLRVWSAGCSCGLELLTLVWLTKKALAKINENIEDWTLEFYGTDEVKDVIIEAERIAEKGEMTYEEDGVNKTIILDTEGFDINFLLVNHLRENERGEWTAWHKAEGGFDIVFMRNTPTGEGIGDWARRLVREKGLFAGTTGIKSISGSHERLSSIDGLDPSGKRPVATQAVSRTYSASTRPPKKTKEVTPGSVPVVWYRVLKDALSSTIEQFMEYVYPVLGETLEMLRNDINAPSPIPQYPILYGEDILKNVMLYGFEDTLKMLNENNTLNGGGFVVYMRDQKAYEEEKDLYDKLFAVIKTSLRQGERLEVIEAWKRWTYEELDRFREDPAREIRELIELLKARNIREENILGVIRGNDVDWNEINDNYDLQIPVVIVNDSLNGETRGVFSFAEAIALLIQTRIENASIEGRRMWIKCLDPIAIISNKMYEEYLRYRDKILTQA